MIEVMITTTSQLHQLIHQLEKEPFVALDTEFHREHTFWSQLCLIQIATPQDAWIVDALSPELDLQRFWEFLQNTSVCKVLHSARQDLEIFWHKARVFPAPFFDTQVGVLALGYPLGTSYHDLVYDFADHRLLKEAQITDWTQRPLSKTQSAYALDDVRYLVQIYEKIKDALDAEQRLCWVKEEMDALCQPSLYQPTPLSALLRLKPKIYKEPYLQDLARLAWCRETLAMEKDLPRRHVVSDRLLLEWASTLPTTPAAVLSLRSAKQASPRRFFIDAACAIMADKKDLLLSAELPTQKKKLSSAQRGLFAALKFLLQIQSHCEKISPHLVATKEDLEQITQLDHFSHNMLPKKITEGWRFDIFGKWVDTFLQGASGIYVQDGKLQLIQKS